MAINIIFDAVQRRPAADRISIDTARALLGAFDDIAFRVSTLTARFNLPSIIACGGK